MNKTPTFQEYLQDKHASRFIGLDDDMPDDFDEYMENLEPEHLLDMAQKYGNLMYKLGGEK